MKKETETRLGGERRSISGLAGSLVTVRLSL